MKNKPIGVFDSGVGGLTVVNALLKKLPSENIIYFGDTARVPYGNKSAPTIKRFSREIMDFMTLNKVKVVIAACNTASSLAVHSISKEYKIPIIGVIEPGAKEAVSLSKNGKIGVIGTDSTIKSGAYERVIKKISPKSKVFSKSCPLFVPLVENRMINDEVTYKIAEMYLRQFNAKQIDTLILGCTHYPLLKKVLEKILPDVRIIDSAISVAESIKEKFLKENIVRSDKIKTNVIKCYVSDDASGFEKTANIFLRRRIKAKKIII